MRPVDKVSYAVRRVLGITMTNFALRLGVTRTQLYAVINGDRPSASLRARIAAALGVAITDIWPPDLESSSTLAQAGEGVSNNVQGASTHG
jgi:transcriptional regulator with XRE-family HTH domain